MENKSVDTLHGIGPIIKKQMETYNIRTIADLANANPETHSFFKTHIMKAKRLLENESTKEHESTLIKSQLIIESHTWYERKIQIPIHSDESTLDVKEAIIYELCVEAFNRIAFLCSWIVDNQDDELCTMTYSPQLILHFNADIALPELKITLPPEVYNRMENKNTLDNVLWETNMIRIDNNQKFK